MRRDISKPDKGQGKSRSPDLLQHIRVHLHLLFLLDMFMTQVLLSTTPWCAIEHYRKELDRQLRKRLPVGQHSFPLTLVSPSMAL
jgi:hypothetical protein